MVVAGRTSFVQRVVRPMRVRVEGMNRARLAGVAIAAMLIPAALYCRGIPSRRFSSEEVRDLIRSRRYDEAESLLQARLSQVPGTPEAHVLMAVSSLSRPIPRPVVALDH